MYLASDRSVSLVHAARTLYGIRTPNDAQIARVFQLMKSGALPARDGGTNPLKWTTTETALAEFMARRELRRAHARNDRQSPLAKEEDGLRSSTDQRDNSAQFQRVYRHIWRDYFLAVMFRRRAANRSVAFHRAVLAGQACLLLLFVGAVLGSVQQIVALTSVPVEHRAVERWIQDRTDAFLVKHWRSIHPGAGGDGSIVRVEYRYRKDSPRWIHTQRTFHVVGDKVTEVLWED